MFRIAQPATILGLGLVIFALHGAHAGQEMSAPASQPAAATKPAVPIANVLDATMKDIDGKDVPLATYRGKVILIVNVASKCGLTPQYKALQALYEKYADEGFVILAFPANNFRNQEPGTDAEIKSFCQAKYSVTFPVFSKISVKGQDQHPLYAFLTARKIDGDPTGEISWNFEKFLVGRDGRVIHRFAPRKTPDSPEVVDAIEAALKVPMSQPSKHAASPAQP